MREEGERQRPAHDGDQPVPGPVEKRKSDRGGSEAPAEQAEEKAGRENAGRQDGKRSRTNAAAEQHLAQSRQRLPDADGYTNFLAKLVEETKAYPGQVLFVHGDTHFFKLDKPLIKQDNLIENFTRLETFGSPNVHWIRVTVDPTAREVFTVHPMIVKGN